MNHIFLPLLSSFVISVFVTPISLIFIKKFGFIDDPKTHKHPAMLHTKPIPRGGGIPLFLGIWILAFFFIPVTFTTIMLFFASLLALIIGTLDDKYDLSPFLRFGVNIICAILVVSSGITIPFITNPLGGIFHFDTIRFSLGFIHISFAQILAVLWIVWVMNMLNWSKGVDGQMPGVVAISSLVIGLLSLRFPLSDTSTQIATNLSFMITGSTLGFLLFNFYPAKIIPGYGATAIYLLLASVSMVSTAKLATAILVMGVPLIDGIFTILRRISSGKSPFYGDKGHLHHLLLKAGFDQRGVAIFYWIISAVLGIIALNLSSTGKAFAILMVTAIIGGGIFFLHMSLRKETHHD